MSGADLPTVSVVIPCFNYGRYVTAAVGSALTQTGVRVDVTIIDDASTDGSGAVVDALAAADPRVRVVHHETNRGHVETSNEALGLACGEFVVKLDADDLLTPGSLQRSTALMRAHPGVAFCYGYAMEFETAPSALAPSRSSWTTWDGADWIEAVLRRGHNVIRQPEVVIRRSALEATGGYRPELRWAEDYHLWLRLARGSRVGRVNGPVQGLYRVHSASFTSGAADRELVDLDARAAAVELFLSESSGRLADVDRLTRVARRALARNARELAGASATSPQRRARLLRRASELDPRRYRNLVSVSARVGPLARLRRGVAARMRWRRWRRFGV